MEALNKIYCDMKIPDEQLIMVWLQSVIMNDGKRDDTKEILSIYDVIHDYFRAQQSDWPRPMIKRILAHVNMYEKATDKYNFLADRITEADARDKNSEMDIVQLWVDCWYLSLFQKYQVPKTRSK